MCRIPAASDRACGPADELSPGSRATNPYSTRDTTASRLISPLL
jgi:hypothetical protein